MSRKAQPPAIKRFAGLVTIQRGKRMGETAIWRMQVAARDAILSVDVSTRADPAEAVSQISEVFRVLLNGSSASIILNLRGAWEVAGAVGKRSDEIIGMKVDLEKDAITARVLKSKKPYYFSSAAGLDKALVHGGARYANDTFCSLPLLGHEGDALGVVNIAGMERTHPIFKSDSGQLLGLLNAAAAKVAKLKKNEELKTARDDIESLKQAEVSREKLLYMTIHDLKNPLTLINSNLASLEEMDLPEVAREIARLSRFGGQRMLDMVVSILDAAKLEAGNLVLTRRRFDLAAMARELAEEFDVAAQSDAVKIALEGPVELMVEADESLIRRVLANLLDNAMRHAPADSVVKIRLERAETRVRLAVEDEGGGVPEAERESVFNAFGQARAAGTGSAAGHGLGLTFCKLAVEAHGGRIYVEDRNGAQGARFVVELG